MEFVQDLPESDSVVRGVGFTENGAEFSILGVGMVLMDLDSSAKFYFVCSEVCSDLEQFWDVFPVQFSPYHCETNVGFLHGSCDFVAE